MNRSRSAVPALAVIGLLSLSPVPAAAGAAEEIRDLEREVNAAYEANDLPGYFAFYASDFLQFLPDGRTDLAAYKTAWTAYIGSGNRIQKAELSDLRVQVGPGGNTAVASYLLHVQTRLKDGTITDENNQESDVWFKRNGEWKIVFLHYSAAPKKGAP